MFSPELLCGLYYGCLTTLLLQVVIYIAIMSNPKFLFTIPVVEGDTSPPAAPVDFPVSKARAKVDTEGKEKPHLREEKSVEVNAKAEDIKLAQTVEEKENIQRIDQQLPPLPDQLPSTTTTIHANKPDEPVKSQLAPKPLSLNPGLHLECKMFPPNMPLETTEWLNIVLKQMVQQQHRKDINARLRDSLNKEFALLEEKSKILSYIYASNLSVGDNPPELKSIKILPSDPSRRDLEFLAKMVYNGGFFMELHTQIQLYTVVEAHLKVSVLDCFGDVCIRVTTVPDSDTDCYVYVMLTEDPQFKLDIQSALGTFTDLSMIDQIITSTLRLVLRRSLVDPSGRKWRWSPYTGLTRQKITPEDQKILVERRKKKKNLGPVTGRLHLHIREAEGMLGRETTGTHDPYCVISFNRQVKRTKVFTKTLNPKWDEHFAFDVFDHQDYVIISAYDRDRLGKDEFIGNAMVLFGSLPAEEKINYVQILKRKKKPEEGGTIRFELMFEPFSQNRTVIYSRDSDFSQFDNVFIDSVDEEGRKSSIEFSEAGLVAKAASKFKSSLENLPRSRRVSPVSLVNAQYRSGSEILELFAGPDGDANPKSRYSDLSKKPKFNSGYLVSITVVQARGLMSCDKTGLSDPYALVHLGKNVKRTRVMKESLSPLWNETIKLYAPSNLTIDLSIVQYLPEEILVEVFDWNRIYTHKFMGEFKIDLKNIQKDGESFTHDNIGRFLVQPLSPFHTREKSNSKPNYNIAGEMELKIEVRLWTADSGELASPGDSSTNLFETKTLGSADIPDTPDIPTETLEDPEVIESAEDIVLPSGPSERSVRGPETLPDDASMVSTSTADTNRASSIGGSSTRPPQFKNMKISKESAKTLASNISTQFKNYLSKK